MSTTPAFSPMPASSLPSGVSDGRSPNARRCTLEDLYEQCSDHITEYMASSEEVGRRPRMSRIRAYSSDLRPSSAHGCAWSGVPRAASTVSTTGQRYRLVRRSEEHTSELQSRQYLVCRLLLEKKKNNI